MAVLSSAGRAAWRACFVLMRSLCRVNVNEVGRDEGLKRVSLFARQACLAEICGDHANIFKPCFCTIMSSLIAMPLGRFTPVSHFSTVDSLVLR